jgi:hypothetical protein
MTAIKLAAGTADITPAEPVPLGGYVARTGPFRGIADRLEANALLIVGAATRVVLVSVDTLFAGNLLRTQLKDAVGLSDEELFLCASHTHFAPMMAADMPRLGVHDERYVAFAAGRIGDLIRALEGRTAEWSCTHHAGEANHAVNRRAMRLRLTRSGVSYGCGMNPNPGGEKNERIEALKFAAAGGGISAILWNYACHPTAFPFKTEVSAEYPGVVRDRLREIYGDVPILFLQGFAGDVRPPFTSREMNLPALMRRVFQGPQFRSPELVEWHQWARGLAGCVESALASQGSPVMLQSPQAKRVSVPEERLGSGGHGDKPLIWHRVELGGARVIGINAEPVTAYRKLIEQELDDMPLFTAGYIDQTHCYLPLDRMLAEGGYEVAGFRPLFGYDPSFRPGLQSAAIDAVVHA